MKILGIIPARYNSSRFPGKPLANINGKPMIQKVYEQASKSSALEKIIVATDHEDIYNAVKKFGGNVCITKSTHKTGTDRCCEVQEKYPEYNYYINIQGDEPFINPEVINKLSAILDNKVTIATLVKPTNNSIEILNPNVVKCIFNAKNKVIYFSRAPIPYYRINHNDQFFKEKIYYKHIGIYAYRSDALKKLSTLKQTTLEMTESLEQLRWLENEFEIKIAITHSDSFGIDTPEDLKEAIKHLSNK